MKQFYLYSLLTILFSMAGLKASAYDIAVKNAEGVTIYYNYINNSTELEVTYKYYDTGSIHSTYSGAVVIPSSVTYQNKTYSVTSIGSSAFGGCTGLTSVTIPNSVTSIGESAFYYCTGLTSITIPNSVTSIGDQAFSGCRGLTSVTIGNGVREIGRYAFEDCSGLTKVIVSDISAWCGITFISDDTYSNNDAANPLYYAHHLYSDENTEITDLVIPNSVTSIGREAFYKCTGLTSVTIPNSVTNIGYKAFSGCTGLTKVIVSDIAAWCGITFTYKEAGSSNYNYYDYSANPLYYAHHLYSDENTEITNLVIPNSVTSIGYQAFRYCSGLTSVTIPNSVTSIGQKAFDSCSELTSVTMLKETPIAITADVFSNRSNAFLYVPQGCRNAYMEADYWKEFKLILEILPPSPAIVFADPNVKALCVANWDGNQDGELDENEAAAIDDLGDVFKGNATITSFNELKYFTGLTSIGGRAFEGCTGLTSITIPNSVTSIGVYAFDYCI